MTTARCAKLAAAAALWLTLSSCSDPEETSCPAFDDFLVDPAANNPEGVPYPTSDLGLQPATTAQPGDRAPNFAFHGYRNARFDEGPGIISMADFYDPQAQHHRLLHLMVAAMWCPNSIRQTDDMAAVVPALRAEGLVVLQVFIQGRSQAAGPGTCDLESWAQDHRVDFNLAIDAGAQRIGKYVPITAVPWNALIDTRTMEVIDAGIGAPADYEQFIRDGLTWIDQHPPAP